MCDFGNGTAVRVADGAEKVKLEAACRMIAVQLKRMLQLMRDCTEADEASIAYLLLMNKVGCCILLAQFPHKLALFHHCHVVGRR